MGISLYFIMQSLAASFHGRIGWAEPEDLAGAATFLAERLHVAHLGLKKLQGMQSIGQVSGRGYAGLRHI
jgi:hypothetical protein